jgi:hypothetical protein
LQRTETIGAVSYCTPLFPLPRVQSSQDYPDSFTWNRERIHRAIEERANIMSRLTRGQWIGAWFATVAVAIAISIVVGATVTLSSIAMLVAMSVVPPAIVLLVWRGAPPATAAELLYAVDESRDGRS